jgi:hypothetical protein
MDPSKDDLSNTPTFKSRKDQDAEKGAEQRAREQPTRQGATNAPNAGDQVNWLAIWCQEGAGHAGPFVLAGSLRREQ